MRTADESYAAALAALGKRADEIPAMHMPSVTDDDALRREVQRQKRSEWLDFSATVDQETLNAVEPMIRGSESAAVAALNYLEDHELAEVAHTAIHRAAFMRRGLYGCHIVLRDDDEFWTNCSINMSHLRAGMSAGLISDFECSICGRMVEDCDHNLGEVYDKTASRDDEDLCSICRATECEHQVGETYATAAYANARNVIPEEVSMVARPRYPQARIVEKSIDLGPEDPRVRRAAQHNNLNCDACLGPCKGFNDMRTWEERRGNVTETDDDDYVVDNLGS
ncbi:MULTISPECIES: hypothetical protein [Micrococcaceae]|uniref:hypothetical protein n=1 Tax=Micrococcaceae TaxID=1268 RepID=UPI00223127FD|nr:hypothetical protein [Paenarthrobacter sp. PAE-2]MCW3768556.1 hypothetical protein [Paenarthrobacter sp. PAE-2]